MGRGGVEEGEGVEKEAGAAKAKPESGIHERRKVADRRR